MRELHGVVHIGYPGIDLKHEALLFDRFHVWELQDEEFVKSPQYEAELDFLRLKNVVVDAPPLQIDQFAESLEQHHLSEGFATLRGLESKMPAEKLHEVTFASARDLVNRYLVTQIESRPDSDIVPLCEVPLPEPRNSGNITEIASIALHGLPVPDQSVAWEDILSFRAESRDKQWGFRRWLHAMATKKQTEAEIRDDIEWSLNEYAKELDRFKLKRSVSFMETYVIPTVEALESFKPSSFLKGIVSIKKRKIELLEAEGRGPGREVAYVFDARRRFGAGQN